MSTQSRAGATDASSTRSAVTSDADGPAGWKRAGLGALGVAIAIAGLRRRSVGGVALAFVGGWLTYRAVGSRVTDAPSGTPDRAEPIAEAVTIGRPADELAELLREPETLGRIASRFADVTATGEDRHRWTVRGPFGRQVSWETRTVEEEDGERLRWEVVDGSSTDDGSLVGSTLPDAATVVADWEVSLEPAPGDRGTTVTLEIRVDPPGGALGAAALDRLDVVPETIVGVALDRFKSLAETGEIPTLEGNPSARGRGDPA